MFGLNLTQGLYGIIGAILLGLILKLYMLSGEVDRLSEKLVVERAAGVVCITTKSSLEAAIEKQNGEISKLKADYDEKVAELDAWKNKPEKVKYKWRTKVIYDENTTECDKLKAIIDGYGSIGS